MPSRPARQTRLAVELLESRETPATAPWSVETFDATPPGSRPPGWSAWASDRSVGPVVSAGRALGERALASTGGSATTSRAWLDEPVPADVRASAAVFLDSLIPAQVFVRAKGLDGPRPVYYAASVARGTEVKLLRVRDGIATVLGSLRTRSYLSGIWLDVSLTAQGDHLQVRARRRDTGEWLTRAGEWQADPASALDARDRQIASTGRVGVGRGPAHAGTVFIDEFRTEPGNGDITAPVAVARVTPVGTPLRPGTVAGFVRFQARVRDTGPVVRVEFLIDGNLVSRRVAPPFRHDFETRNLTNGSHRLTVRAWDSAGNVGEASRSFAVYNQLQIARPAVPRHHSHIRYAALAYYGNPMGPTEQQLLRDHVDLVIPNARYLAAIESAAPATPKFVYSNISNLYLDLLTDWLAFADRTRVSRERAFYHVAKPTAFVGDSPSSQPVNWFWNVQRGPAASSGGFRNLTGETRFGGAGDVPFGARGEALYTGYPERFRELNVRMTRDGADSWVGEVEYPTTVDASGRATAWNTLPIGSDMTAGLRRTGRVTFDPPVNWKPAVLPGSAARLYYVRVRTVAGSAADAPIASAVLGRDYVAANFGRAGTIPAFDRAADSDRDGYLSDLEYTRRQPGFDARFEYEARLFYPNYGQMRFVANPGATAFAAWAADYHRRLLATNLLSDGVFMDNSSGSAPTGGAVLVESPDAYPSDFAAVLGAVHRAIAPKWVLANTTGGGVWGDGVARQVPATIEEFALRPLMHTWAQFRDLADKVTRRLATSEPPGYLILDTLSTGGSPTDPRTRLAALAYYYLLADPDAIMLMTWGGEEPASAWSRHWFEMIGFDVGKPSASWSLFAGGADPANGALTFNVYQRRYSNALVLYKPVSYTPGKGTGTAGPETATTHDLGGTYRPLNADGTLGLATHTVTLRNGEGAILVRA